MENKENKSELIIYQTEDGKIKIDVRFQNETVWLTQQLMSELFQTTQQNISLHIQNILEEDELTDSTTHKEFLSVQQEGNRSVKRTLKISIGFFKTVQNKIHWAISGKTAAEIIRERADSSKTNMGLTIWRGAKVRKHDVAIAKNYLSEQELLAFNNLVEQYLIFAEGQAMRRIPMHMEDWIKKLDGFLSLNEREILAHAGKISHELALGHAEAQYDKFNLKRIKACDAKDSDFDRSVKMIERKAAKRLLGKKGRKNR